MLCVYCSHLEVAFMVRLKLDNNGKPGSICILGNTVYTFETLAI